MDQPNCPDRGADSNFSFLMAVLAAALMALHTLCRAESGQTTGFYLPRCAESALTLGSSGFFLTQALQDLSETDPANTSEWCAAQWEVMAAGLVLTAAFIQFELVQYRRRTGQLPDLLTSS